MTFLYASGVHGIGRSIFGNSTKYTEICVRLFSNFTYGFGMEKIERAQADYPAPQPTFEQYAARLILLAIAVGVLVGMAMEGWR